MRNSTYSLLAAAALAGAIACGADEISYPIEPLETFVATLSGANEPTPTVTNGTGSAIIGIFQDTILTFRVDVATLDSARLAHIHAGAAGINGPVLVTLFDASTVACKNAAGANINVGTPRCSTSFSGPINQSQAKYSGLPGTTAAYTALGATARERFDSLKVLLRTGGAYVNVHNIAYPGGVIRGQTGPQ